MTENEYNLIKKLETDIFNINKVSSDIILENKPIPNTLYIDIEKSLDTISKLIVNIKSPDALNSIKQTQMGLIEILAYIDENVR